MSEFLMTDSACIVFLKYLFVVHEGSSASVFSGNRRLNFI